MPPSASVGQRSAHRYPAMSADGDPIQRGLADVLADTTPNRAPNTSAPTPQDLLLNELEVSQSMRHCFIHDAIIDTAIPVHHNLPQPLQAAERVSHRVRHDPSPRRFLKQSSLLARQAGYGPATDVDRTGDGGLQQALTGPSFLDGVGCFKARGRNGAKFAKIPVEGVDFGQDAFTIQPGRPARDSRRRCASNPRTPAPCATPRRTGDLHP
jgi:hypothetical protein